MSVPVFMLEAYTQECLCMWPFGILNHFLVNQVAGFCSIRYISKKVVDGRGCCAFYLFMNVVLVFIFILLCFTIKLYSSDS